MGRGGVGVGGWRWKQGLKHPISDILPERQGIEDRACRESLTAWSLLLHSNSNISQTDIKVNVLPLSLPPCGHWPWSLHNSSPRRGREKPDWP